MSGPVIIGIDWASGQDYSPPPTVVSVVDEEYAKVHPGIRQQIDAECLAANLGGPLVGYEVMEDLDIGIQLVDGRRQLVRRWKFKPKPQTTNPAG